METTEKKRRRWMHRAENEPGWSLSSMNVVRLCRDVDALVLALGEFHGLGCAMCEMGAPCDVPELLRDPASAQASD